MNGRQSHRLVVGWEPRRTYKSASPDPPAIVKTAVFFPAGTSSTQNCWEPLAPEMLDTGTPSVSTATPPTVTITEAFAECCTVPDAPVTVKVVVAGVAVAATETVSVELPPAVTVAGEKDPVTPEEFRKAKETFRAEVLNERRGRFFSAYMVKAKDRVKPEINVDVVQRIVSMYQL